MQQRAGEALLTTIGRGGGAASIEASGALSFRIVSKPLDNVASGCELIKVATGVDEAK
jgi:hypothetical protein